MRKPNTQEGRNRADAFMSSLRKDDVSVQRIRQEGDYTLWLVEGRTIVTLAMEYGGFEVYKPASETNKLADLKAAILN